MNIRKNDLLNNFENIFHDYLIKKMATRSMAISLSFFQMIKEYPIDMNNHKKMITKIERFARDREYISSQIVKQPFFDDFISLLKKKAIIHYDYLTSFVDKPEKYMNEVPENKLEHFENVMLKALSNQYDFVDFVINFDNFELDLNPKCKNLWNYQKDIYQICAELEEPFNEENIFYIYKNMHYVDIKVFNLCKKIQKWQNQEITFDNGFGQEIQKIIPVIFEKSLYLDKRKEKIQKLFMQKLWKKANKLNENSLDILFKDMPNNFLNDFTTAYIKDNKNFIFNIEKDFYSYLIKKLSKENALLLLEKNFIFDYNFDKPKEIILGVFEQVKEDLFKKMNMGFDEMSTNIKIGFEFKTFLNHQMLMWKNFNDAIKIENKIGNENVFNIQDKKVFIVDLEPLRILLNKYSEFNLYPFELNLKSDLFSIHYLSHANKNDTQASTFNLFVINDEVSSEFNLEKVLLNVVSDFDAKEKYEEDEQIKKELTVLIHNAIREEMMLNKLLDLDKEKEITKTVKRKL